MRNRGSRLLRVGGEHFYMAAWMPAACQESTVCDNVCANPMQISGIHARGYALGVGHIGIEFARAVVFEKAHKCVVKPHRLCACGEVDHRDKAQPMSQFMQDDGDKVVLIA